MPGNSSRSKGKRSCRCFGGKSLGTFKCPKFQALIFGIFETSTQTSPKHPKGTFTIGTPRRRYYRSASRNVPRLVIFQPSSGRIGQTFANKIRESPSWRQTSWSLDYKSFLVVGKLSQSMLAAWVSLVAGSWGWQSSTSTVRSSRASHRIQVETEDSPLGTGLHTKDSIALKTERKFPNETNTGVELNQHASLILKHIASSSYLRI